jgi:hypothetical protein
MPKMVVYELFEVTAASPEEAVEKAQKDARSKKSILQAAPSLRELTHPVHLLDAEAAFGSIGSGGKVSAEDRIAEDYAESAE